MKQPILVTVSKDGEILEEIEFEAEFDRDRYLDVTSITFPFSLTIEDGEAVNIKLL